MPFELGYNKYNLISTQDEIFKRNSSVALFQFFQMNSPLSCCRVRHARCRVAALFGNDGYNEYIYFFIFSANPHTSLVTNRARKLTLYIYIRVG